MQGERVTLEEMLQYREERALLQKTLLDKYQTSLISFTMNIAGPVKDTEWIRRGFVYGCRAIELQLKRFRIPITCKYSENRKTGSHAFFAVGHDPVVLKKLMTELEEESPVGRLFDIDVLTPDGNLLSREAVGISERSCLICGKKGKGCARNRQHSVEELQQKTKKILTEFLNQKDVEEIASLAVRALLTEVGSSPKPGLVDMENNGSHNDMDYFTFFGSASVLWPFFFRCARIGKEYAAEDASLVFNRIRKEGILAELDMLKATGGVNTHKGAIFSMGILCTALGRMPWIQRKDLARVQKECVELTRGIPEQVSGTEHARTNGEKIFARHGLTGARGEAADGFPTVFCTGLPIFRKLLREEKDINLAGCVTLLMMLCVGRDTNMIARSSLEEYQKIIQMLNCVLSVPQEIDIQKLRAIDKEFIRRNLSPGGSADMLAMVYFLHFLLEEYENDIQYYGDNALE